MADRGGRWYLGRVVGNRAARVTVLLVALAFAGGFWLLQQAGAVEPSPTVAVIGVALFVVVAFPIAMLVGGATDRRVNPEQ